MTFHILVIVYILHNLLYNYIKIEVIFLSKKKKKNTVNKLNKKVVDKTIEKDVNKNKDFVRRIDKYDNKKKGNTLINILVVLTIISCLGYIASTIINIENLKDIILALLLFLFTIFFVSFFSNKTDIITTLC